MQMTKTKYLILAITMLLPVHSAFGQQPKPSPTPTPDPGQERVNVNIRRVRLPITVTDNKKQFVSGLTQNDFVVMEDKVPQQIESFTSEQNNVLPLYVSVLMDTSPSTAGKLKFEQESAMNFIQTVIRPRRDRVLFATFDHEVTLRQDFTDRLELLDRAVFGVKKTGNKTALYDAVWQFCDEKMRSAQGRRVIVVITDGDDNSSHYSMQEMIRAAQDSGIAIYSIGLLSDEEPTKASIAKRALKALAEGTGGMDFYPNDQADLDQIIVQLERQIRDKTRTPK